MALAVVQHGKGWGGAGCGPGAFLMDSVCLPGQHQQEEQGEQLGHSRWMRVGMWTSQSTLGRTLPGSILYILGLLGVFDTHRRRGRIPVEKMGKALESKTNFCRRGCLYPTLRTGWGRCMGPLQKLPQGPAPSPCLPKAPAATSTQALSASCPLSLGGPSSAGNAAAPSGCHELQASAS